MIFGTEVEIGKLVDRDELISVLERAAQDFSWNPKQDPVYKSKYILGSVEKKKVLSYTRIHFLQESGHQAAEVCLMGSDRLSSFGITRGIISENNLQDYLSKVSGYL